MNFPVIVSQDNGHFTVRLLGNDDVQVVRTTREEAVAAMSTELQKRVDRGELAHVDVPARGGAMAVFGKFADDETLEDICAEIYAERKRDRDESHA